MQSSVTVLGDGRGVACSCLDFHHRFLCRRIFAVLKKIVDKEDDERDVGMTPEEYGQRILDLIGATEWVGGSRRAVDDHALHIVTV